MDEIQFKISCLHLLFHLAAYNYTVQHKTDISGSWGGTGTQVYIYLQY